MKYLAAVLILGLLCGGATAAALVLPREPIIDILDGPAYAFANSEAASEFLAEQELSALSINPQILGSIDVTDTTTLPNGTIVHASGAKWTLTCTYLTYRQERTGDANGYASWAGLHWGVYELTETSTPVRMVVAGHNWDFGWSPLSGEQFVVCAKELNKFFIRRDSPARDAGADWGQTSDFYGNPIVGAPDIGAFEWQPGLP